jgi:periplasmic protein TonB
MKIIFPLFLFAISLSVKAQEDETVYVFDANWKPSKVKNARYLLHRHQTNDTCWQWDFYNFKGPLIKSESYRDKDGSILDGDSRYYNDKGICDSVSFYHLGKKVDFDMSLNDSSVFNKVEKESEYPGGIKAWNKFLTENLVYPQRAISEKIEGSVLVGFIIDKYGNVIEPFIQRSVEFSLDEESIRIIKRSGTWLAAFQNGHEVKSYKMQPLNFKLQ